jgi:hypothetical protein
MSETARGKRRNVVCTSSKQSFALSSYNNNSSGVPCLLILYIADYSVLIRPIEPIPTESD